MSSSVERDIRDRSFLAERLKNGFDALYSRRTFVFFALDTHEPFVHWD